MTGVHVELPQASALLLKTGEDIMPYLPLDQAVPNYPLARRRHAISGGCESPYRSRPRMRRRGAISYEMGDTAAQYIRYLGTTIDFYGCTINKATIDRMQHKCEISSVAFCTCEREDHKFYVDRYSRNAPAVCVEPIFKERCSRLKSLL